MNKLILGIITGVLFAGSLVTTILYHDLYKQEQVKAAKAQEEVKQLTELVEANKHNTDTELKESASKFLEVLFHSDENEGKKKFDTLLDLTTGEAKESFSHYEDDGHDHEELDGESVEGMKSKAEIKETVYNRESETKGLVVIDFEHSLTKDGVTSKTVNQATVKLVYKNGAWKVYEYDIKTLL